MACYRLSQMLDHANPRDLNQSELDALEALIDAAGIRARIGPALNTPPLNNTAVGISAGPPARDPTSAPSLSLACTFCRLRVRKRARCLLITGSDA